MSIYPRNPNFKRYFKGNPLFHPPIPGSFNQTTSIELTPRLNTGNEPGPGSVGPLDPRLYYPRTLKKARRSGKGCSSCKWQGVCKVFYFNRNFGYIDRGSTSHKSTVNIHLGRACESWNVNFPPLPPEAYSQDGFGIGNPLASSKPPVYDPFSYEGQYGNLRSDIRNMWDSLNV
jgi:hypothetical protein